MNWLYDFFFAIKITDVLIALFTGLLWWSTHKLWGETERLAEDGDVHASKMEASIREAARSANAIEDLAAAAAVSSKAATDSVTAMKERTAAQMRAYVTVLVNGAVYQERNKDGGLLHFEARPILVNAGHTPAKKVSYWANSGILPVPLPADYVLPDPPLKTKHSAVLGPHQNFVMNSVVREVVDDSEVAQIKSGVPRALYVWGRVDYEDVFGESHVTNFCHHVFWIPGKDGEIIGGHYTPGRNDAD